MKNMFLTFVCLLSLCLSRGAIADSYVFINDLGFDTEYQWNSEVVAMALHITPFTSKGDWFAGGWFAKENVTVAEVLGHRPVNAGANGFFVNDWFANIWDRVDGGINEKDKIKLLDAMTVLQAKFNELGYKFSMHTAYYECVQTFKQADLIDGTDNIKSFCSTFARNIVKVNNSLLSEGIQVKKKDLPAMCKSFAAENSIGYPVVCGGECNMVGNDVLALYYLAEHKIYSAEFEDLCDGTVFGTTFWYVVYGDGTLKQYDSKDAALKALDEK